MILLSLLDTFGKLLLVVKSWKTGSNGVIESCAVTSLLEVLSLRLLVKKACALLVNAGPLMMRRASCRPSKAAPSRRERKLLLS